jgi:hypothetical protein
MAIHSNKDWNTSDYAQICSQVNIYFLKMKYFFGPYQFQTIIYVIYFVNHCHVLHDVLGAFNMADAG